MRMFAGHSNVVWSICMANEGQEAITVSHDESIRFWDTMKVGFGLVRSRDAGCIYCY